MKIEVIKEWDVREGYYGYNITLDGSHYGYRYNIQEAIALAKDLFEEINNPHPMEIILTLEK